MARRCLQCLQQLDQLVFISLSKQRGNLVSHGRVALLFLFFAAAVWLALLGFSVAIEETSWGRSGHPSNSVILFLCSLTVAPAFALAGCSYAIACKARFANPMPFAIVVTSICVLVSVVWFLVVFKPSLFDGH
jgi:multisubunit Na+/H+ antiporter MnhC subunit